MTDVSSQERWMVMLVQADRFAEKEAYTEAVARCRIVCDEVRAAVEAATDPAEKRRLERTLLRAEKALAKHREAYDAWRAEIAERRAATVAAAEDEMKRPLPSY